MGSKKIGNILKLNKLTKVWIYLEKVGSLQKIRLKKLEISKENWIYPKSVRYTQKIFDV